MDFLKHIELISKRANTELKRPKSRVKANINWKTGLLNNNLECQISGLLDGIVSVIYRSNCIDEFIVEIIGNTKGNKGIASSFEWETPFRSVLGDMLRVACYNAAGKSGIIVMPRFKVRKLVYTVIKFDQVVKDRLRRVDAKLAVDMSRPQARNLLLEKGHSGIFNQLKKVFKKPSDIDLGSNLLKFSLRSVTNDDLLVHFEKLIRIILNK